MQNQNEVMNLKYTLPPLIAVAALLPEIRLMELDEPEDDLIAEGWEIVIVDNKKIAINAAALEEKEQACDSIFRLSLDMKELFFPYVEECSKLFVPLLSFVYNPGVRITAYSILPVLLCCIKTYLLNNGINHPKLLSSLFEFLYPAALEAISNEYSLDCLVVGLGAITQCISFMGVNVLNANQLKELLLVIEHLIKDSHERRNPVEEEIRDEGIEETDVRDEERDEEIEDDIEIEDNEEDLTTEDDLDSEIAEAFSVLAKSHKSLFWNAFQETNLPSKILQMSQSNSPYNEKILSVCFFDDLIEHIFEQSYSLCSHFVPIMIENALDPHPGVRQAATYGLGICAQNGGSIIKPYLPQILEALIKAIQEPLSRASEKMSYPTENAISSVGRIIQYQPEFLGDKLPELVDLWVSWLPIQVDKIEAKIVHQQLCHFIKNINPFVFGPNGKNLVKVLDIFGSIVETNLVSYETQFTIKEILATMYKQIAPQLFQNALLNTSPQSQNKLRNLS